MSNDDYKYLNLKDFLKFIFSLKPTFLFLFIGQTLDYLNYIDFYIFLFLNVM